MKMKKMLPKVKKFKGKKPSDYMKKMAIKGLSSMPSMKSPETKKPIFAK